MMSFYGGMTDYQAFLRGGEILEGQLEGRRERGKAWHKTIQTVWHIRNLNMTVIG